jgi:hypothetical protein
MSKEAKTGEGTFPSDNGCACIELMNYYRWDHSKNQEKFLKGFNFSGVTNT